MLNFAPHDQIRKHDAKVSPKNAVRNPHSAGKRRRPRKLPSPEHGNSEIATTDIGNEGEKSHTAKVSDDRGLEVARIACVDCRESSN